MLDHCGRTDVAFKRIPYRVAHVAAGALELLHRAGVPGRPRVTRRVISQFGLQRTLNIDAARTRLGYTPMATSRAGAQRW